MDIICKTYTKPFWGTFFNFLLIHLNELNFVIWKFWYFDSYVLGLDVLEIKVFLLH